MGCQMSSKYPQICQRDEQLFEQLLQQYCNKDNNAIKSQTNVENYGLVSFSKMEEKVDQNSEPHCSVHWTDWLEVIMVTFIVMLVGRYMWGKLQAYRKKKKIQKLEGIRVLYRQAMLANEPPAIPSAPINLPIQQQQPASSRVTLYTPMRKELERSKIN